MSTAIDAGETLPVEAEPVSEVDNSEAEESQATLGDKAVCKDQAQDETERPLPPAPKHVFILSSAGKPIYTLHGDEDELGPLMGLMQGLLSVCLDTCGDELESMDTGSARVVWLRRGDLTFVAMSTTSGESVSYMRLQLEYLYLQVLFLLTSKVQAIFDSSPAYDLRGLLGGTWTTLQGVLDMASPASGDGRLLSNAVHTVWMDPALRLQLTEALHEACSNTVDTLYAVWLYGEELVALSQPRAPHQRLRSEDLLLLVNFVATQPSLKGLESWTPLCLPGLQASGYVYAYIGFFKEPQLMGRGNPAAAAAPPPGVPPQQSRWSSLLLISANSSPDQFYAFKQTKASLEAAATAILGRDWGLYMSPRAMQEKEKVLTRFAANAQAVHFLFRVPAAPGAAPAVSQCVCPPFQPPYSQEELLRQRVWNHYERSFLRLRLGSCQEGRVAARRRALRHSPEPASGSDPPDSRPPEQEMLRVFGEAPIPNALVYEAGSEELVVAMAGDGFELHVCFKPNVIPADGIATAARLARIMQRDRNWLFIADAAAR